MQAVFRFRGAEEVVISNHPNSVMIEVYDGYDNQCDGCKQCGPGAGCTACPKDIKLKQVLLKCFSKSEARSIASAIMGAAAEL